MPSAGKTKTAGLPVAGDLLAGKYRITGLIGEGGMGAVFRAHHELLRADVAVKLLLPQVAASSDAVARFLAEARAVAKLRSQHVAQVMDVGSLDNGSAYMALELLEGTDLATLIEERGPVAVEAAVDYALQALEGVAHAHAMGIVHRDLKPANLFLTSVMGGEPMIKVLDFGISKATLPDPAGNVAMTQTNALLGSPAFMSPEQVRSSKSVDHRTDIWSMGVILYRLLTGEPPFGGDNIGAMFAAILEESPPLASALRAEVPEGLSRVVAKCLERKREARYQTAAELADALTPYTYPAGSVTAERIRRTLGVAAEGPVSRVASVSPEALAAMPSKKVSAMRARAISDHATGMETRRTPAQETYRDAGAIGRTAASPRADGDRTSAPWVETATSMPRGRAWLLVAAAVGLVGLGVLSVVVVRGGRPGGAAAAAQVGPEPPAPEPRVVATHPAEAVSSTAPVPAVASQATAAAAAASAPRAAAKQAASAAVVPTPTPASAATTELPGSRF